MPVLVRVEVIPGEEALVSTADDGVSVTVPAGALDEPAVLSLNAVPSSSALPSIGTSSRAVGNIIELRLEREGEEIVDLTLGQPVEVRVAITEDMLASARGDTQNIVVQQRDPYRPVGVPYDQR